MERNILARAAEFLRKSTRHKRWRRAFTGMAAVVVFITSYMMILPAITMTVNQGALPPGVDLDADPDYTAELTLSDGSVVTIGVYDPEGNVPEGAELVAELFEEDSEDYLKAEDTLLNSEDVEPYDGMLAMDLHFEDADGNEVEPTGSVYVDMEADALLPANVDPESVAVQHHVELDADRFFGLVDGSETTVEVVADGSENTGDIVVDPTESPAPSETPAVTETPEVTETPATTESPEVTETPAPEETPAESGEVDLPEETTPTTDAPVTDSPVVSTLPEVPESPEPPVTPEEPSTLPELPSEPVAPVEPETPAEPEAPVESTENTTEPAESTEDSTAVEATFAVDSFSTFTITWNVLEEVPEEPELICGLEEHSHFEDCYDADGNLICTIPEHTHTEDCYAVELPEEEIPMGGFPEELPEGYVPYEFTNEDGLSVLAYAPEDAFGGQEVTLFAEVLAEDSDEYAQAQANLEASDAVGDYDGMVAMDIRFQDADGKEVEPNAEAGPVYVDIRAEALIPEDVDTSTLAVQHHAETTDGGLFGTGLFAGTEVTVETVADANTETGTITAVPAEASIPETLPALADEPMTEEIATLEEPAEEETEEPAAVPMNVEASFGVKSFSTFTITWVNDYSKHSVTVHYVNTSGNEIRGSESTEITFNSNEWVDLSAYAKPINNYSFVGYYQYSWTSDKNKMADADGAPLIAYITDYNSGFRYKTSADAERSYQITGSWDNSSRQYIYNIYLVYKSNAYTFDGETPDGVTVNLFNYSADRREVGRNEYVNGINRDENGNSRILLFHQSKSDYEDKIDRAWGSDSWNVWTNERQGQTGGVYQGILEMTLPTYEDENGEISYGYPQLRVGDSNKGKSLSYLFDTTPITNSATTWWGENVTVKAKEVYEDVGNLFQQDANGYWYYDSSYNFAKLDEDGNFKLYDRASNQSENALFAPFNEIDDIDPNGLHFGMTVMTDFLMPADGKVNGNDMVFEFAGDDDVWVFIDGVLVLDMGGIHDNYAGSINFATGEVWVEACNDGTQGQSQKDVTFNMYDRLKQYKGTDWVTEYMVQTDDGKWTFKDYSNHNLQFYYMERGGGASNCKITFNLITVPKNTLLVGKDLTAGDEVSQEIQDFVANSLSYTFEVLKTDENGVLVDENGQVLQEGAAPVSMIADGTYRGALLDSETMQSIGDVVVEDGRFTLKAGQLARFSELLERDAGSYIIRELLPENSEDIYNGVVYQVGAEEGSTSEDGTVTGFDGYNTNVLNASTGTTFVVFTNKVDISKLAVLNITKVLAPGSQIAEDEEFTIQVQTGDDADSLELLPAGTAYYVGGETKTVVTAGEIVLTGGETARIGLIAGTHFSVAELDAEDYTVNYAGVITSEVGTDDSAVATDSGVTGALLNPNAAASVTVTNSTFDFNAQLTYEKELIGWISGDNYEFQFEVAEVDQNGEVKQTASPNVFVAFASDTDGDGNGSIRLNTSATGSDMIYFNFNNKVEEGIYYFKLQEVNGDYNISYDTSYYIVTVAVDSDAVNDADKATITGVKKYVKGADGTYSEDSTFGTESSVKFFNSKVGSLTLTKVVEHTSGGSKVGNFTFTLTMKDVNGAPISGTFGEYQFNEQGEEEVTLSTTDPAGTASITIEGLPAGAMITITEMDTSRQGYATKMQLNGGDPITASTTTATISAGSTVTVTCTNTTGAVLPSTGGMGVAPYLTFGSLLTLGAGLLLLQRRRKEGSDAV